MSAEKCLKDAAAGGAAAAAATATAAATAAAAATAGATATAAAAAAAAKTDKDKPVTAHLRVEESVGGNVPCASNGIQKVAKQAAVEERCAPQHDAAPGPSQIQGQ